VLEVEALMVTTELVQVKRDGVEALRENEKGAGAVMVVVAVDLQPKASVAVRE
jgi:hypothetical protein